MKPQRIEPGPGQESVWDYPRPPALSPTDRRVRVEQSGITIADTTSALRVLETSQPPAYYLPPEDVSFDHLVASTHSTFCEWKGAATYFDLVVGDERLVDAAWTYLAPNERFAAIVNHVAFYPQVVEACWVDDHRVVPNAGSFYGGWVTPDVVGPFKGEPGTAFW